MNESIDQRKVVVLPDGRLNTANAAIYTGFSEKTLAMMRCKGLGPKFIKRGRIFYFKTDLDEWIEEGRNQKQPRTVISNITDLSGE